VEKDTIFISQHLGVVHKL